MALGNDAYLLYGQGLAHNKNTKMSAIPRNKYIFSVQLLTIDGPVELTRIANVQMPSFVYRTQTLNKYNDKSIVQTGIDYTPITLTAYDTKDAAFETFLKSYAKHYISGPMNEDDYSSWLTGKKGFELQQSNHYITQLIITRQDSNHDSSVIEIFNPFIQNADADTLDYSDSSPSVFRVSFQYEGYRIKSDAGPKNPVQASTSTTTLEASNEETVDVNESGVYATKDDNVSSNKPPVKEYTGRHPESSESLAEIDNKTFVVPRRSGLQR